MLEGILSSWRAGAVLGAAALAMLTAGCDQGQPQASQQKVQPPAPVVSVSKPAQREIVEWDEYTGRFDATQTVEIRARVSGYLNEVRFKDGQAVKQGDVLFAIDPRPFERALEQAKAELFAATTKVENANLDVVRGKPLVERKIISDKTFDDRESLMRDAQAAVKVAEAKVKSAELDLSFATITSPITGRISRTLVTAGNWISAGSVSGATLLTTIVSQDPIYIYFDVNENNYIKYKRLAERGVRPAPPTSARRSRWRCPTSAASRTRRSSTSSTTASTRAPARCGPARCWPTRRACSRPACSRACASRARRTYTALLLPDEAIGTDQTNKYVLRRRRATARWRAGTSSSGRWSRACAWCAKASRATTG